MVNSQPTHNHSRSRQNRSNAGGPAVALLKFLVLFAIIVCAVTVMIYPNRDALSGMWENTFGGAKSVPPVSDTAALPANKPGNDLANQPATSQQDISQPEKTVSEEARELERRIQVEILNGCGVRGLADRTTNFLRAQGIDVVSNGNFDNFDVLTTRILDRSDNHERAAKVAELFGLSSDRILLRKDAGLQLDVTIVLGADYKSLKPFKN